jgi:hypothetical protein
MTGMDNIDITEINPHLQGKNVAADLVQDAYYQRVKISVGEDSASPVDVSNKDPMPVTLVNAPSASSGSALLRTAVDYQGSLRRLNFGALTTAGQGLSNLVGKYLHREAFYLPEGIVPPAVPLPVSRFIIHGYEYFFTAQATPMLSDTFGVLTGDPYIQVTYVPTGAASAISLFEAKTLGESLAQLDSPFFHQNVTDNITILSGRCLFPYPAVLDAMQIRNLRRIGNPSVGLRLTGDFTAGTNPGIQHFLSLLVEVTF